MHIDQAILQFSPGRSGSTLVTQVLKQIFSLVRKSHEFEKTQDVVVIAYRHPLGIFCSIFRAQNNFSNYSDVKKSFAKKFSVRQWLKIIRAIKYVKVRYAILRRYYSVYGESSIYLCYEKFYNNPDNIFFNIEKKLGFNVECEKKENINKIVSRENNIKISEKFKDFNDYDKNSGIHGFHVSIDEQDWQSLLPDWLKFILLSFFRSNIIFYNKLYSIS